MKKNSKTVTLTQFAEELSKEVLNERYDAPESTTLVPDMLDGIISYARTLPEADLPEFLEKMFPSVPPKRIAEVRNGNPDLARYTAVIRESAVRDAQIAVVSWEKAELINDDDWRDVELPLYVGTFAGTRAAVRQAAAEYAGTDPENIELIPEKEVRFRE